MRIRRSDVTIGWKDDPGLLHWGPPKLIIVYIYKNIEI